jgi:hypothetical protein
MASFYISDQLINARFTSDLCAAIRSNDPNGRILNLCGLCASEPDFTRSLGEALHGNSYISSITIGTNDMGMSNEFNSSNIDAINSPLLRYLRTARSLRTVMITCRVPITWPA